MTPGERNLLLASASVMALTGIVWGWTRWLCAPVDEFAVIHHPVEPMARAAHLLAAPVLVLALGIVYRGHARPRQLAGSRKGRRSGWLVGGLAVLLVASGHVRQVVDDPGWRQGLGVVHLAVGLAWVVALAVHASARLWRRPARGLPVATGDPQAT